MTLNSEGGEVMSFIMSFSYDSRPIQTLLNQIRNINKRDGIDLQPKFQRGYIWSSDFKDKLLYSIIKSYPIGNVSLRVRTEKNDKGAMFEVVDGQQRLTTIYKFIENEYVIQSDVSRSIIEYIIEYVGEDSDIRLLKLKKKLHNKGKILLSFKHLPQVIQDNILAYNISITNITNASDEEITEYFRYLQNQERLRAGEIINSVPDTELDKYLKMINDIDLLLDKLSFGNKRKQFDRVFYSILGLIDGKIGFGVTDKEVMRFVSECSELNEETRYEANSLKKISSFYTSVGCMDEYMTLYLATGLKRVSNELPQDQDEQLMLKEVTLPQALEMIDQGEIEDAKTIMAIYYWQGMNNRG